MKRLINKIKRLKVSRVQREREVWNEYIQARQEIAFRRHETNFAEYQLELPVQLKDNDREA